MRKYLALLAVVALAVTLFALPVSAADGDLVYEMTVAEIDALVADPNSETVGLRAAGSPLFTKDGTGLLITERTANWNALDLRAEVFADAAKDYTVVVGFKAVSGDLVFQISNTDGPYAVLAASDAAGSATVTFKGKGSEFHNPQRGARLHTPDGVTDDYVVTSIKVYEGNPPSSSGGGTSTNPKTGVETYILVALGALALAAAGAVVFARKAKA